MPRKKSSGARQWTPEKAIKRHAVAKGRYAKGPVKRRLRKTGAGAWVDPDEAPELTKQYFELADVYRGEKLVRRGRPPSENPKQAIKLRIDADVLEHFRATGPGWQTRINETLRRAAKRKIG